MNVREESDRLDGDPETTRSECSGCAASRGAGQRCAENVPISTRVSDAIVVTTGMGAGIDGSDGS